ncbi:MAG: type III pantothenate kinase [Saprospiraceae bacterium]|jgi:type III pantothenate kinase|tara:strand:- start:2246 stop:2965 length:720 start_codon:yes stop_codon:yes gene_type:complete
MNLCIDIGNTRIKIGVFDKGTMIYNDSFHTKSVEEVYNLIENYKITEAISSSTRKSVSAFEKRVKSKVPLIRLNHKTPVPIENMYLTPKTLGKDRLAVAIGCTKVFPNKNCLIIDAGTCITYDIITADKRYLGGNISPGLRMRAEAMDTMTSTLPLVEPVYNKDYIGKSTVTAMQNGIVYGTLLEIESLIAMIKQDIGDINVIITGGDAPFFANLLKTKIFVHSFLVLEGLDATINYAI